MEHMVNEHLSEEEIERLWIEEAVRRDTELDDGRASMRDAEVVFKDARARLSKSSSEFSGIN